MYIKLVIFDLDGTLLYTIKDITIALNYALKKNGLDEVSIDEAKYMVGSGVDVLIQKAVKEEKKLFDNVKEDYSLFYKDHNMIQTNPYQGIMHLLKMLKQTGIKIAVLSNKPDNDTNNVVKYYFGDLFDYVLGSKENLRLKPESDGINVILDHFKIAKENTIYLGDSNIDVLTAQNANLFMGACLWGYRKRSELDGASIFFNSAKEVENYIIKNNNLLANGAIIYDKPKGISSQEALIEVKYALTNNGMVVEKIGHAGTLDPLATGVLVILLNEATKLSDYILASDKEYLVKCKLGIKTDTYDIDGTILDTKKVSVDDKTLDATLKSFLGKQKQVPPMYSAIKVDGKKLYDIARSGKTVDLEARDIEVFNIERVTNIDQNNEFSFKTKVSKGTYIRSLCNDLGLKLNTYGIVSDLRRTKSGRFSVDNAYKLDDIKNNNFNIIKMVDLIDLEKININEAIYKKVIDGKMLKKDELNYPKNSDVALIYLDKLIAIYVYDENMDRYKAKKVWN